MFDFGKHYRISQATLLCALLLVSPQPCVGHNARERPAYDKEILVSAAISMKGSLIELAQKFEQRTPRTKVRFNFGASGQLAQQIRRGADVDVFVSAAPQPALQLISEGLAEKSSLSTIAQNELVVISPSNTPAIRDVQTLVKQSRVAIGNPKTVPAGEYARKFLQGESLYPSMQKRHQFIYGESVRQILQYVQTGNVDAGLVYKTDTMDGAKVTIGFSVPTARTGPISYVLVTLNKSKNPHIARGFALYCMTEEARSILKRRGFKTSLE